MKPVLDTQNPYYIVAEQDGQDPQARSLKHGETFGVFDAFGDIGTTGPEQGIYHNGTRHLSRWRLKLAGHRPFLLSSSMSSSSHVLTVDMTNPDIRIGEPVVWPRGGLHLRRTTFLWEAGCYALVTLTNYTDADVSLPVELAFDADFSDLFEVRGTERAERGRLLPVRAIEDGLVFGYEGLDLLVRQTIVQLDPLPRIDGHRLMVELTVRPGETRDLTIAIGCAGTRQARPLVDRFTEGMARAGEAIEDERSRLAIVDTSSDLFDEWLERSRSDIAMMVTHTRHGRYPYAGIPWFSTMFGRDGILTALSVLWADPSLARGVLMCLAATQATTTDAARDCQPGKILHEARGGEMAALGEIPFGAYYGSIDATPLFVLLAGRYFDRTGDLKTIERLWPHLDAALRWIDTDGDPDGDGFVEYARATHRGLLHQGWKDSHDAVSHADGTLADGPIALCEVQSYVYGAKHHAAELAEALGDGGRAKRLRQEAERLHASFERAFWCEELGAYALALDGDKRPCRVLSSNAGQCLVSGISVPQRARRVADALMAPDMFSGWGIRTLRHGEARYNPMAYHNGSIWPHDTALIALGFARYGFKDYVVTLLDGMFGAAERFDLRRLPELFCGFARRRDEPPTRYPTACAPQAWAAASSLAMVQALLGLEVDGRRRRVILRQPRMPQALEWMRLTNVSVDDGGMDLLCERRGDDVGISVIRRHGDVRLMTEK